MSVLPLVGAVDILSSPSRTAQNDINVCVLDDVIDRLRRSRLTIIAEEQTMSSKCAAVVVNSIGKDCTSIKGLHSNAVNGDSCSSAPAAHHFATDDNFGAKNTALELEESKKENGKLKVDLELSRTQCCELQELFVTARKEYNNLQKNVKEVTALQLKDRATVLRLEELTNRLMQETQCATNDTMGLTSRVDRVDEAVRQATARLASLVSVNDELAQEVETLNKTITNVRKEGAAAQEKSVQLNSVAIQSRTARLALEEARAEAVSHIRTLETEIVRLEKTLDGNRVMLTEAEDLVQQCMQENNRLQRELQTKLMSGLTMQALAAEAQHQHRSSEPSSSFINQTQTTTESQKNDSAADVASNHYKPGAWSASTALHGSAEDFESQPTRGEFEGVNFEDHAKWKQSTRAAVEECKSLRLARAVAEAEASRALKCQQAATQTALALHRRCVVAEAKAGPLVQRCEADRQVIQDLEGQNSHLQQLTNDLLRSAHAWQAHALRLEQVLGTKLKRPPAPPSAVNNSGKSDSVAHSDNQTHQNVANKRRQRTGETESRPSDLQRTKGSTSSFNQPKTRQIVGGRSSDSLHVSFQQHPAPFGEASTTQLHESTHDQETLCTRLVSTISK